MGELTGAAKAPHEAVRYGRGTPSEHCSICAHYVHVVFGPPRCEVVKSPILPGDWCDKWRKMPT